MIKNKVKIVSGLMCLLVIIGACGGTKKQSLNLTPGETYSMVAKFEYGRILGPDFNVLHSVEGTFHSNFKIAEDGADRKKLELNYSDISITKYENNFAQDLPDMDGLDEYVAPCLKTEGSELMSLEIDHGSEFIARSYLDPLVVIDKHCLILDNKKRSATLSDSIIGYVLRQVISDIYPPANIMKKGKWEQTFSIDPKNPKTTSKINWSYERDDKKYGRYYYGKGNYVTYEESKNESGEEIPLEDRIIQWKGVIQLSLYTDPETGWINKGMIEWRQETPVTTPKMGLKPASQTENLKVQFLPVGK